MATILWVDDSIYMISFIKELEKDTGHHIVHYRDGAEAAEEMKGGLQYQLAVIDRSLPRLDGEEVMKLSKKLHPDVPVVCNSAYPWPSQYADKCVDGGMLGRVVREYLPSLENTEQSQIP
ncbi:response regulator [Candidatus Woesearchaeota archaeon]|nr:response regulator [Candidatus Woesearchaeota archaeon]